jgi:dTDP-glucose 4,6-dehydratase
MPSKAADGPGNILVTGGAGFIGSNFVLQWIQNGGKAVNLDLLTYAGNRANLSAMDKNPSHSFVQGDIADPDLIQRLLQESRPQAIVHFAAESHVDRSIVDPGAFIRTNVQGTFALLEQAKKYWSGLDEPHKRSFRFLHVSTDEVYGSLKPEDPAFSETTPYAPNSPYAASKAGSDHLVRAYFHTYGLPILTTNCSNNYGPFQFPEKLIPLMILNAVEGRPLPIYGDGGNVRDWLHVEDHCAGLLQVLRRGRPGEKYNVGGNAEHTNVEIVDLLCDALETLRPAAGNPALKGTGGYRALKTFVADRPGHDRRYAIDATKIRRELGWQPRHAFADGLRQTASWYLENRDWCAEVQRGRYDRERLGLSR